MRNKTRLSSFTSSDQMNLAPLKSCSKYGSFGSTSSSVYSFPFGQSLSSKSTVYQFSGSGIFSTRGCFRSESIGSQENFSNL